MPLLYPRLTVWAQLARLVGRDAVAAARSRPCTIRRRTVESTGSAGFCSKRLGSKGLGSAKLLRSTEALAFPRAEFARSIACAVQGLGTPRGLALRTRGKARRTAAGGRAVRCRVGARAKWLAARRRSVGARPEGTIARGPCTRWSGAGRARSSRSWARWTAACRPVKAAAARPLGTRFFFDWFDAESRRLFGDIIVVGRVVTAERLRSLAARAGCLEWPLRTGIGTERRFAAGTFRPECRL